MLVEISIDNLGVIPHSHVEFAPGLNVLTGETGAGKTMVVTGLRLLTGGRADASKVRTGAEKAGVEGVFNADTLDEGTKQRIVALTTTPVLPPTRTANTLPPAR